MSLADKIAVNTRYTRSTNVERDRGSRSIIEAYLPTARGVGLLDDITGAFGSDDQPRAWSLIGPYGSGNRRSRCSSMNCWAAKAARRH